MEIKISYIETVPHIFQEGNFGREDLKVSMTEKTRQTQIGQM